MLESSDCGYDDVERIVNGTRRVGGDRDGTEREGLEGVMVCTDSLGVIPEFKLVKTDW